MARIFRTDGTMNLKEMPPQVSQLSRALEAPISFTFLYAKPYPVTGSLYGGTPRATSECVHDLEISSGIGYSSVIRSEGREYGRIQSVRAAYGLGRIRTADLLRVKEPS